MSRFEHCLAHILRHEGGYVDNPKDPGGATNFGITRKTLARWRQVSPWWKLPKSQVRTIKQPEVKAIYRSLYWNRCRASILPIGLDYTVFDFAVNSGPSRAIRHLQAVLGVMRDGIVGPITLNAIESFVVSKGVGELIKKLINQRLGFLRRLTGFKTFGRGWTRRVAAVRRVALAASATSSKIKIQPKLTTRRKQEMNILSGYKTYIVAIAMLIAGIGQMLGIDLPGFNGQASGQLIIEALAVLFLRRGIKNEISNA
ncbi:MAG: hypothetical protein L3J21_07395 [Devosiaceae bacterium]|nr:hypothetical protein [Devosiaceae bacterium]